MYDDKIKNTVLDDLESKVIGIVDTSVTLASQGYLVNRRKYIKLDWSSLLIHAFENIHILNKDQQHKVELLYNKITTL